MRESYIPQVIHLNAQVRLNTSYENQRPRVIPSPAPPNRMSPQPAQSSGNPKHKENFTIVLPPTANMGQVSQNDISPSFMMQTFALNNIENQGKVNTETMNQAESESEINRESTLVNN